VLDERSGESEPVNDLKSEASTVCHRGSWETRAPGGEGECGCFSAGGCRRRPSKTRAMSRVYIDRTGLSAEAGAVRVSLWDGSRAVKEGAAGH